MELKKKRSLFLGGMFLFAIACFFIFYEHRMNAQNTTAYALNYSYGLIPRGFVGSIIYLLNQRVSFNLYTYENAMRISMVATILLFVIIFYLYHLLLKKCDETNLSYMMFGLMMLSVFLFPEFWTWNNFGRTDEYLMIVTVVCLILLCIGKCEWLIILAVAIACLVHVGFVFTNVALILVLLFYKALTEKKRKKYYWTLCILSFLVVSALFLYMEIFRKPLGMDAYHDIVALAKSISEDGKSISDSLLDSEILGLSVFEDEMVWRKRNIVEFPLFLLFFWPYLYVIIYFFKNLLKSVDDKLQKFKYFVVAIGMITIVPSLLLKVDYGRWMFCIVFYYIAVIIMMLSMGDRYVWASLQKTGDRIKGKVRFWPMFFLYPFLFMPFRDVYISDITTKIMNYIMGW